MEVFPERERERERERKLERSLEQTPEEDKTREREREMKRPPLVRREREVRKTTKETGKLIVSKSNLPVFDVFTSVYSFWGKIKH